MEHFSALKFAMIYQRNMNFQKSPNVWKKVEEIGLGSFKSHVWKKKWLMQLNL